MAFDLEWSGKSGEGAVRTESMVLRMEPPEAIVETSRLREFEILGVAGDVVPVPPCYWVDAEGAYLPPPRSDEPTSELQSLLRISYAVFCLKKQTKITLYTSSTTSSAR